MNSFKKILCAGILMVGTSFVAGLIIKYTGAYEYNCMDDCPSPPTIYTVLHNFHVGTITLTIFYIGIGLIILGLIMYIFHRRKHSASKKIIS